MILRNFQEGGDFTWRVSDCEELVGLLTGDDGVGFRQRFFQDLPESHPTPLPYPKWFRHIDYGLQHKIAVKWIL